LLLTLQTKPVRSGVDWTRLGEHQGYWSRSLSQQLRLAQDNGQLEALLNNLCRGMHGRAQILDRWRSGLSLPLAAMLLATLAAPLPAVFGGAANWPAYVQKALVLWVSIWGGITWLRWLWLAPGARPWRQRLLTVCPWRNGTRRGWQHRLRFDSLQQFTLAYAAGRPLSQAAASAAELCLEPQLASQWRTLARGLQAGTGLDQLLPATHLLDPIQAQWVMASEAAGRLDQALWQSLEHSQTLILEEALAWATWSSRVLLLLGPGATYIWLRLALAS
jgi:type II secretory pathway component PulF